jgi:hypothetical protein
MALSFTLLALGVLAILTWLVLRDRGAQMPGEVVYSDTPETLTLFSQRYRLAGRPDYVIRQSGGFVPVEVKSRQCGKFGPYTGERAQLFAYCLLTEEELGGRVARGELRYANRTIIVPFGEPERERLSTCYETCGRRGIRTVAMTRRRAASGAASGRGATRH